MKLHNDDQPRVSLKKKTLKSKIKRNLFLELSSLLAFFLYLHKKKFRWTIDRIDRDIYEINGQIERNLKKRNCEMCSLKTAKLSNIVGFDKISNEKCEKR